MTPFGRFHPASQSPSNMSLRGAPPRANLQPSAEAAAEGWRLLRFARNDNGLSHDQTIQHIIMPKLAEQRLPLALPQSLRYAGRSTTGRLLGPIGGACQSIWNNGSAT